MIVLLVELEVFGQSIDALSEERHLDLGRSGVALLGCIILDDFLLTLCAQRHRVPFSCIGEEGCGHSRDVVQRRSPKARPHGPKGASSELGALYTKSGCLRGKNSSARPLIRQSYPPSPKLNTRVG